jgi:outer membrane cobalamin receptor
MKKAYWLCAVAGIALPGTLAAQTTPTAATQVPPDVTTGEGATAGDPQSGDIIVTGIRASLKSSEAIKRNATMIVDAVSAEDVGKFPDVNIADSLQRVTGVAIDRSGGEGQFITVRGRDCRSP